MYRILLASAFLVGFGFFVVVIGVFWGVKTAVCCFRSLKRNINLLLE